jgi:hypothetical protein
LALFYIDGDAPQLDDALATGIRTALTWKIIRF